MTSLATGAVLIRDAHVADVEFIAMANVAMALETEALALDVSTLRRGVAAVLDQPARGFYLIGELAGKRAGCLLVTHEWSDWRNGDWWWLQSVYVLPQARRCGIFRALHADVARRACAANDVVGLRLYVESANHAAQSTYAAFGFRSTHYRLLETANFCADAGA